MWNQMLHLELTAPGGDWSQKALINLHDELTFNVFDKVKTAEADAREANVRTLRDERRWLGGFSLPFATLYRNGKVEGAFPLGERVARPSGCGRARRRRRRFSRRGRRALQQEPLSMYIHQVLHRVESPGS